MYKWTMIIALMIMTCLLHGLEIIDKDGRVTGYQISQFRDEPQQDFSTARHKKGMDITDNWQGIDLHAWLKKHKHTDWQSLRFESSDNYMVRLHKAELDTMPGYIALKQNGVWLDSTEVRVIFPKQRDMFWIRGIARIYLEDFKPIPQPRQTYIWESAVTKIRLYDEPEPFKNMQGYRFSEVMSTLFAQDEGSVVMVSRDGIRMRLEYPRHLKGSILERDTLGNLNLKSPLIPAGMWLKDIVYLQCGPYALLRQEFLYHLPQLSKILDWQPMLKSNDFIKAGVTKTAITPDSTATPPFPFIQADEWIEFGQ